MLARPKHPPREATNQESKRSLLGLSVIERDGYQFGLPFLLDAVPVEAHAEGSGGASNSSQVESEMAINTPGSFSTLTSETGASGKTVRPQASKRSTGCCQTLTRSYRNQCFQARHDRSRMVG